MVSFLKRIICAQKKEFNFYFFIFSLLLLRHNNSDEDDDDNALSGFKKCFASIIISASFFTGNLVVILVVLLQKKMRTSTNFFFTNLAFSDLLVALFCIFQNLTSNLQRAWPFGGLMCKMYYFTQTMSYTASIFTMVIISIERYIAICYPLKSKKIFQMRNFQVCILLVWLLSAILCSPNLMLYGVRQIRSGEVCVLQKLQQLVTNTRIFNIINFVLLFLFPMILMSFLYIRLCLKLRTKSFTFIELKKKKINEFFICTESSLISDTNNNNNNSSLLMDGSWSTSKCILKRNNYSLSDFKEDFSRIYQQSKSLIGG